MASNENNNNHDKITINWNNIINHPTRSIDDADLGKVQGLFEPFVVTEKGTINKEKFFIPKSLFQRYDGEVLCFNITEQQAKDTCMRNIPPSEDEARQIVQTITENSTVSTREKEVKEVKAGEKRIVAVKEKGKNQQIRKLPTSMSLSRQDTKEEEIVKKIKIAANDLKDIILSGAKVAKQKVKERQEISAEKQAVKDAKQISKMGDLATQFASAFEDILSEIRTRTFAEQEQIYTGFLKLMEQQRGLVSARRNLATKLKGSVRKPALATTTARPSLRGKEQPRLTKEAELPPPHPQLPEMINPPPRANTTTTTEEKLKTKTKKAQIITASKKGSPEPTDRENPTQNQKITTTTTTNNEDDDDAVTKRKRK